MPYFHVFFTVPAPIAEIALHNEAIVYGILFTAAAETLRVIAAEPRRLAAEIGSVAVLRNLRYGRMYMPPITNQITLEAIP